MATATSTAIVAGIVCCVPSAVAQQRATATCEQAEHLAGLGRADLAERIYGRELLRTMAPRCAIEGMARLARQRGPCVEGDVLRRAGRKQEAAVAYRRALAHDPRSNCARRGLGAVTPAGKTFEDRLDEGASALTDALLLLAVALALVAVAVLVLVALVGRVAGLRRLLDMLPPIRRLLGPQLHVEDFDDVALDRRIGPSVAATVRAGIPQRISEVKQQLGQVAGESDLARALRDLQEVSQAFSLWLMVLVALDWLLPRKRFTAVGVLQPDTGRGPGVTLTLQCGSASQALATLWASELGFTADGDETDQQRVWRVRALARSAGMWVSYGVADSVTGYNSISDDAMSFVLFHQGIYWDDRNDRVKARRMYDQALERDEENAGALGNLGILALSEENFGGAVNYLERSVRSLEQRARPRRRRAPTEPLAGISKAIDVPPARPRAARRRRDAVIPRRRLGPIHRNPDWYRMKYNLAATHAHLRETGEAGETENARINALQLAVAASITSRKLRRWPARRRHGGLMRFLDTTTDPSARILLVDILLDEREAVQFDPGDLESDPGDLVPQMRKALDRRDPAWLPSIIALLASVKRRRELSSRTHYNLGCVFTKLARKQAEIGASGEESGAVDQAISEIATALRQADEAGRRQIIRTARRDPSLAFLKGKPSWGQRLHALLERYSKPTSQATLAELKAIGENGATALAQIGITSWRDLIRLRNPSVREQLQGIDDSRVEKWMAAHEFLLLEDMGTGYVNLLHDLGPSSLSSLASTDVDDIYVRMVKAAGPAGAPPRELVGRWIAAANAAQASAT